MVTFLSALASEIRAARADDDDEGGGASANRSAPPGVGARLSIAVLTLVSRGFALAAWLCRIVIAIWLFDLHGASALVAAVAVLGGLAGLRLVSVTAAFHGHPWYAALAGLGAVGGAAGVVAWVLAEEQRPAVAGLVVASEVAGWAARWLIADARSEAGNNMVVI